MTVLKSPRNPKPVNISATKTGVPSASDSSLITQTFVKKRKADVDHLASSSAKVPRLSKGLALVKPPTAVPLLQADEILSCLPEVLERCNGGEARQSNSGYSPVENADEETLFSPPFHALHREGEHSQMTLTVEEVGADENQPRTVSSSSCHTSVAGESAVETHTALALRHGEFGSPLTLNSTAHLSVEIEEEDVDEYSFDPFLFIKNLPPLKDCLAGVRRTILPRQTRRSKQKTLVLDLDETLVHSSLEGFDDPDFTFPVEVNRQRHLVNVKKRPHLRSFLEAVAKIFEVVVFTASQRVYAEQLLNIIDPTKELIRYRLYRDACVLVDGNYLKDLTVLGRDLQHTVIVDNSPQAFGFQLANGIPIESWYDNKNDRELLHLLEFLKHLVKVEDVRPVIARTFKLHEFVAQA